jgi:hypothetical protein
MTDGARRVLEAGYIIGTTLAVDGGLGTVLPVQR